MRARVKDVRERVPSYIEAAFWMGLTFAFADLSLVLVGYPGGATTVEAAYYGVLAGLIWDHPRRGISK